MRYLLSSLAVSGAYAAFPNTTVYVPRSPIFTDEACFHSTTRAPVSCADANAININRDANGNHQANCAHFWTGDFAANTGNMAGYISTDFGPKVAAMPGCCSAMVDLILVTWATLYGSPYSSSHPHCISKACIANNAAGNMTSSIYGNGLGGSAAVTAMPKTAFAGRYPTDAVMVENLKVTFQDNSKCFDAAVAHMGANARFNNGAVASIVPAIKSFFSSTYVTSSCTQTSVTFPAADSTHCNAASTGGQHHIVSSNECYDGSDMPTTNCTVSGVDVTMSAPNCAMHSTSSPGKLVMAYGPIAAAIPGCCATLPIHFSIALTKTMMGYGFPASSSSVWNPAAQCQALSAIGGCVPDNTTVYSPAYFAPSGNSTAGNQMVGTYPSLTAYNNAQSAALANGGACIDAANAYAQAQSTLQGALMAGAFNGHTAAARSAATSVACFIDGVDFGASSYSCCKKIRDALVGKWVADAYSTETQALCADTTCADKVASVLRATAANNWSRDHKRMLDVVGISTAHANGTPVDVCKTTLPGYLTTTSTTTVAPTTTTQQQNQATSTTAQNNNNQNSATTTVSSATTSTTTPAPAIQVTASYTSAEVLPSGATATSLMASVDYKSAKKEGLATALLLSQSAVTITGFSFARRQLAEARKLSSTNVVTAFSVAVASTSAASAMETTITNAASAIKNATDTAMASKTWSGDATFSAAPTMATPTIATPQTVTVPTLTSGTVTVNYYSNADCSTTHGTHAAVSGAIGTTCLAGLASDSFKVDQCNTAASKSAYSGASCGGSATTSTSAKGVCVVSGTTGVWQQTSCSSSTYNPPATTTTTGTAATSGTAAVSASLAGMLAIVSTLLFC